jgi:hypothetical protein
MRSKLWSSYPFGKSIFNSLNSEASWRHCLWSAALGIPWLFGRSLIQSATGYDVEGAKVSGIHLYTSERVIGAK